MLSEKAVQDRAHVVEYLFADLSVSVKMSTNESHKAREHHYIKNKNVRVWFAVFLC